jgi:hypothetical protein
MWGSYPSSLRYVVGSTVLPGFSFVYEIMHRGLPSPGNLESRHMTFTVLVQGKTKPVNNKKRKMTSVA